VWERGIGEKRTRAASGLGQQDRSVALHSVVLTYKIGKLTKDRERLLREPCGGANVHGSKGEDSDSGHQSRCVHKKSRTTAAHGYGVGGVQSPVVTRDALALRACRLCDLSRYDKTEEKRAAKGYGLGWFMRYSLARAGSVRVLFPQAGQRRLSTTKG
jgi:hypothetical protein